MISNHVTMLQRFFFNSEDFVDCIISTHTASAISGQQEGDPENQAIGGLTGGPARKTRRFTCPHRRNPPKPTGFTVSSKSHFRPFQTGFGRARGRAGVYCIAGYTIDGRVGGGGDTRKTPISRSDRAIFSTVVRPPCDPFRKFFFAPTLFSRLANKTFQNEIHTLVRSQRVKSADWIFSLS